MIYDYSLFQISILDNIECQETIMCVTIKILYVNLAKLYFVFTVNLIFDQQRTCKGLICSTCKN